MRGRFAKILATVGPASSAPDTLRLLSDVGVDAFRLNFSHGSHDDHARSVEFIRKVQADTGRPITIVADMQGPKLRVGEFPSGQIELRYGTEMTLVLAKDTTEADVIPINHPELFRAMEPGHQLKFDDGKLMATITENNGKTMRARIDVPGVLKNKKGINVIGATLPLSAMTPKDQKDMVFALSQDVDFIALSFVQTAQDVIDARKVVGNKAGIIVKIEKPSAVDQLDDILELADAAMVARGDLGVELPLERVPVVQRQIIRKARALGKPVIVATHMLESMIDAPTPTRAEASDVATAIYQGADAVMLSAETAVGRHPATAVAIMDRIIRAAEGDPEFWDYFKSRPLPHDTRVEDAIGHSVRGISEILNCKAVLGFTATGSTVQRISRERPPCHIVGITPMARTASRLALSWGVTPVVTDDPQGFDGMVETARKVARDHIEAKSGDKIMITAGIPFGVAGTTNTLKIDTLD
ncbi:pyruvate kinase [Fretibacter rubidus]|uniref:pyruvate kinase n=1 Tax=Fretibacter rubidus TaxID=570162 RepID=UPI00352A48CA